MCRRDPNRGRRGLTLIESVVALGLFALASASMAWLLARQIRFEGGNNTRTAAIGLAEREMEDLRSEDFVDIATRSYTRTIASMTYTVSTLVQDDTPGANMKTITTTVQWTSPDGPQSQTLYAIYTAVKR